MKFPIVVSLFVVLFLLLPRNVEGDDDEVVHDDRCIDSAMTCLVMQNYAAAKDILSTDLKVNPKNLKKLYLAFAVEQTRILDYESYIVEQKQFQRYADSIKQVFENELPKLSGSDSTKGLFYLANIYGGISVMLAKTGKIFDGVKNAVTSVSLLRKVKTRDPSFYAADLGIGVFDYYLSTSFKWLPFIEDREEEGLAAIQRAVEAEYPYNYAARNSLCWILIERKEFRQADSVAQIVIDVYPDNTIFLRIQALIALWTGNYTDAVTRGNRLIRLSKKRAPRNWSDLVAGYTVLVKSYYETGRINEACAAAEEIIDYSIPRSHCAIPHIKKNIKSITGVYRKCGKERR